MAVRNDTEIRHLPVNIRERLSSLLDVQDSWTRLTKYILMPDDETETLLFNSQHVDMITRAARYQNMSPTILLLNDWGTFGRKRPTVDDLIELLIKCNFFRAADYLAVDVLKGPSVAGNTGFTTDIMPRNNPNESRSSLASQFIQKHVFPGSSFGCSEDIQSLENCSMLSIDPRVKEVSYEALVEFTDGFNEKPLDEGGRLLGHGAFSTVYLGVDNGSKVAVKRVESFQINQFTTELAVLSKLQHKNVLQLLGYSSGQQHFCLLFEYAENGSLLDCLSRQLPLPWFTRLTVAQGLAQGIYLVHTHGIVHRDVKSANVLLDAKMEPKLGDFGIAHDSPTADVSHLETKNIAGTSVYMPREAQYGLVTPKWDTYSFGVVLLELLSGKAPYDRKTQNDLPTYFEEQCKDVENLHSVLDKNASWDTNMTIANDIFKLSQNCLMNNREHRPEMLSVLQEFSKLIKDSAQFLKERKQQFV